VAYGAKDGIPSAYTGRNVAAADAQTRYGVRSVGGCPVGAQKEPGCLRLRWAGRDKDGFKSKNENIVKKNERNLEKKKIIKPVIDKIIGLSL
jgi:hypothetical protein